MKSAVCRNSNGRGRNDTNVFEARFSGIHRPSTTKPFANGLVVEGRCIPENLASKTLVSFLPLPFELRQTADFIQTGHVTNRAERIAFGGPGLPYYRKTMRVTLYEGQMVNADGTADEPAGRELEK